jgi:hypothetical protein
LQQSQGNNVNLNKEQTNETDETTSTDTDEAGMASGQQAHNAELKKYFSKLFEQGKNTGTIHVVTSPTEVPADFRNRADELNNTQGLYDIDTGETYFITGNIKDAKEAFKTWVHEVGVHRGLSNIIPQAELNSFFKKMYDDIGSETIKAGIPESYHNKPKEEQAEEYLAYLGEKIINEKELNTKEKGIWKRIIDTVKDILNKLFTGAKFTNQDAENIVRAAVQSVYQPPAGPGGKPRGKFLDDVIIRRGARKRNIRKREDISNELPQEDSRFMDERMARVAETYREHKVGQSLKENIQKIREFWQDVNLPIRKLEEAVKERGGKINNKARPYRDINLSFGRMEEIYQEYQREKMDPILDAMRDLVKEGLNLDYIIPYIYAKHAGERNADMRSQELKDWMDRLEGTENEPTEIEIEEKRDELLKKDYSGVSAFDTDKQFEFPDEMAQRIVEDVEGLVNNPELINNLWENINNATEQILDHWKQGGQISEKMYNKYMKQFKYFVPLRGWRHGLSKQLRYDKDDGFGRSLRHAEGRKTLADNPLAYMQAVAFKAIGERVDNEIKNSLLNMVLANYETKFKDLYHIKKVYYVKDFEYNPKTGENEEVWKPTLLRPSEEMFNNGDAKSEFYRSHMKLRSNFESWQHEVIVKREGGDVAIVFDNEMLPVAQAFNRQNTLFQVWGETVYNSRDLDRLARVTGLGGMTNFMKQMFTSMNPVFAFTNFFRDVPEAAITLWIQDKNSKVMKKVPIAFNTIRKDLYGNVDKNSNIYKEYRNFYQAGGATGFTHYKTPEQIEKELTKELKRKLNNEGMKKHSASVVSGAFGAIENWNRLFEDTTRFAVYLSSREAGKSIEDSAIDAKEASVNFNRKGKGTKVLDSIWAFFNPAIQAAQKNFKLAKDHPVRFGAVAGSVVMAGFLEALLNDLSDDDDEYYLINDYVRHNYAVIPKFWGKGNDKYARIPLPQFWRGFHSLGVITYDLMKGKTQADKAVANTMLNFVGGLSPIDIPGFWVEGELSLMPIVPTWAKPVAEAYGTNRNFMGSRIAQEPFTKTLEKQLANSDLHKKNVNPAIKAFTDFLADDIGGKYGNLKIDFKDGKIKDLNYFLDRNPSKIEHLVTSYFGGAGKVATDMVTTLSQLAMADEEVDINNIPLFNSFIRNTPDEKWEVIDKYYDLKESVTSLDAIKRYAKKHIDEPEHREKYIEVKTSDLNQMSEVFKVYDSHIKELINYYGYYTGEGDKEMISMMEEALETAEGLIK